MTHAMHTCVLPPPTHTAISPDLILWSCYIMFIEGAVSMTLIVVNHINLIPKFSQDLKVCVCRGRGGAGFTKTTPGTLVPCVWMCLCVWVCLCLCGGGGSGFTPVKEFEV